LLLAFGARTILGLGQGAARVEAQQKPTVQSLLQARRSRSWSSALRTRASRSWCRSN